MSHLVCTEHNRRVLFTEKSVIHRSDQSICPTKTIKQDKTVLMHATAVELTKPGAHVIGCPCGCNDPKED